MAAVIGENFGHDILAASAVVSVTTDDFKADLTSLARAYDKLLADNLPLVRTMLGELHHQHGDHERQVFRSVFRPLKNTLLSRLESAGNAGELRTDLPPDVLSDLFSGMLFTGVLRRASKDLNLAYSSEAYLQAAVALFLRGAGAIPVDSVP